MKITKYDNNQVIMEEIGRRIREYRISSKITQAEMSLKSGVSTRTISSIENGKDTSLDNIIRIFKVLGICDNLNLLIQDNSQVYDVKTSEPRMRYKSKSTNSEWKWGDE